LEKEITEDKRKGMEYLYDKNGLVIVSVIMLKMEIC
jgi:hypothetical protein